MLMTNIHYRGMLQVILVGGAK